MHSTIVVLFCVGPLPLVTSIVDDIIDDAVHSSHINTAASQLLSNLFEELEYEDDEDEFEDDEDEGMRVTRSVTSDLYPLSSCHSLYLPSVLSVCYINIKLDEHCRLVEESADPIPLVSSIFNSR